MSTELNEAASKLTGLLSGTEKPQETQQETESESQNEAVLEEQTEEIQAEAQAEDGQPEEGEVRAEEAEQEPQAVELGADEFASLLGIETDNLLVNDEGTVSFRIKGKNGDEDVNLEKLLNAHQGDANLTNRSKQLSEQEKVIKNKIEELDRQTTQHAQQAALMLEAINKEYNRDYEEVDWKELRADDPALFTLKKQEFAERKQNMDSLVQQALNMMDEAQTATQQDEQANIGQKLQKEQESMQAAFKAMNVKIDKTLEENVTKFFSETFSEDELGSMTRYAPLDKLAVMAYKAMQYDKGVSKAKDKKVKKLPKVMKPGQKPTVTAIKAKEQKGLEDKFKKSGRVEDAAALIAQRLRG